MAPEQPARIFAVGVNHKSGSAFLRDRLFIDEDMQPGVYARLKDQGVAQAVILSTCDRVEFQEPRRGSEQAVDILRGLLNEFGGDVTQTLDRSIYTYVDEAAVRHVFAVASSLDSQIIGEPQVLGQVREGHRAASAAGMVGRELGQLFQAAYGCERVRSETTIGKRAVSIASAAAQIAGDIYGDLKDIGVLVIGLGEIADLIVQQLKAAGAGQIALTGNGRRAEREAQALGYHYLPMEELDQGLVRADITVTAAGLGKYLVEIEAVDRALRSRRYRPMLFLDGGLPNDIEPGVHDLGDAFVYTLDDLEQVAQQGRMQREAVAREADGVDAEIARWTAALAAREATPAVVALRAHFENLRQDVLTEQPHVSADEADPIVDQSIAERADYRLAGTGHARRYAANDGRVGSTALRPRRERHDGERRMSIMDRLDGVISRHSELSALMASGDLDPSKYADLSREYAELSPIVEKAQEMKSTQSELSDLEEAPLGRRYGCRNEGAGRTRTRGAQGALAGFGRSPSHLVTAEGCGGREKCDS